MVAPATRQLLNTAALHMLLRRRMHRLRVHSHRTASLRTLKQLIPNRHTVVYRHMFRLCMVAATGRTRAQRAGSELLNMPMAELMYTTQMKDRRKFHQAAVLTE